VNPNPQPLAPLRRAQGLLARLLIAGVWLLPPCAGMAGKGELSAHGERLAWGPDADGLFTL
jgi:hypothetical protein